jgi:hypothetical protein
MTTSVSQRLNILSSVLYNNTVRPVICEGWHFTHLYDRIIALRVEGWANKTTLTPSLYIEVPVLSQ